MGARGPKIDLDFAAQVLVDAAMLGDEAAAQRHKISDETVSRYRKLSQSDENLWKLVALKKRTAESQWADGLAGAIKGQIEFLQRAAQAADASDPHAIHAMAGSLKILADIALTSRMIDARLASRAGPEGAADRPDAGPSIEASTEAETTVH